MSTDDEEPNQKRQAQVARRQVEANDIKWLMSSKQGRRVVWRLLDKAGIYRTSFAGNSDTTNFNEGMRNLGLFLVAETTQHALEAFAQMQTEARTLTP